MIPIKSRQMQSVGGDENTIIETKIKLTQIACENTIEKKKWIRKCPLCGKEIISYNKWYRDDSERKKRKCVNCYNRAELHPNYGKHLSLETRQKISVGNAGKPSDKYYWYGKKLSDEHREKLKLFRLGTKLLSETKWKIKLSLIGNKRRAGILHSDETKRKLRIAKAKYIMRHVGHRICPAFNEIACEYFDWLNKWNGWNGRYAIRGGEFFVEELGYWVDYYEPTENVVIEWDEEQHYDMFGNLKIKDMNRMTEIKEMLRCRFFRVRAKTNEIIEY